MRQVRPLFTALIGLTLLSLLLIAAKAGAQQPELEVSLSSPVVEVGESIEFRLSATSSEGSASSPRLQVPGVFIVNGPSVGTQWKMGFSNGRMTRSGGLSATWILTPQKLGKFNVGPAQVTFEGQTYRSRALSVEVVASGSLQRQRRGRTPFGNNPRDPFDSFDPFSNFPNINDLLREQPQQVPDVPEEFKVLAPLDPIAFLRAVAVPTRVYIGQQLRYSVFAYGSRGPFRELNSREAVKPDFYTRSLIDGAQPTALYRMNIGEELWIAAKVREALLFPLRSGKLEIGAMQFGFGGGRYPASNPQTGLIRQTQPLTIDVVEPPLEGRPAGYQLGDVGEFRLNAQVEPRELEAGGSIAVVVTLSGSGNPPHALQVPARTGVDFLTPTIRDDFTVAEGQLSGTKTFTYVVRLAEAGTLDLGEVVLPYFNPTSERYEIARAALGTVQVKPGTSNVPEQPATAAPNTLIQWTQTLAPRTQFPTYSPSAYMSDRPNFWLFLLLAPLSVLALAGLARGRKLVHGWLSQKRNSAASFVETELRAATNAATLGQAAEAASHVERALYAALAASVGIKGRGLLRQELKQALELAAVDTALSERVLACLDQCDVIRFTRGDIASSQELVTNARTLCGTLQLRKGKRAMSDHVAGARS